jgi:hypothetical protein
MGHRIATSEMQKKKKRQTAQSIFQGRDSVALP